MNKEKLILWNGYMHPKDITAEYIASLTIPSCLKLLKWHDRYYEQLRKQANENIHKHN